MLHRMGAFNLMDDWAALLVLLALLRNFFQPKHPRLWGVEFGAALLSGGCLRLALHWLSGRGLLMFMLTLLLTTLLYAALCLQGNRLYQAVICLFYCTTYMQLHTIELALFDMFWPDAPQEKLFFSQLCMCAMFGVNRRFGAWYRQDTPVSYVWMLLISSAIALVSCMLTLPQLAPTAYLNVNLYISAGMLAMNICAFYEGQQLMRGYQEKLELRAVADRIQADSRLMRETEALMQQLRDQRHELQNHRTVLYALCDAGDLDAVRRYLSQFGADAGDVAQIETGHAVVNAVLSQKRAQALRLHIPMEIDAHLPARLPITDRDICSLTANLLANALEASQTVDAPRVRVHMACVKNYLHILVANRVARDVLRENPRLLTTKHHPQEHGVGVRVIRRIVAQYDGMLHFSVQEGEFVADVLIKLHEPPKAETPRA